MKYISFGKFQKSYIYIFLLAIFLFIAKEILGFGTERAIISFSFEIFLRKHNLMVLALGYFSEIIFSYFIIMYLKFSDKSRYKISSNEKGEDLKKKETDYSIVHLNSQTDDSEVEDEIESIHKIEYIHQDQERGEGNILSIWRDILISSFLIVLFEIGYGLMIKFEEIFDPFFLAFLFMVLIDKFLNHANIVAHHMLSLGIVTIICMIIYGISLYLFNDNLKEEADKKRHRMMKGVIEHCYIYIIIYIICYISFCFGLNIQKKIMDYKFVHPYKILFCKGIIGFIISIIALIISTQVYCQEKHGDPGKPGMAPPKDESKGEGPGQNGGPKDDHFLFFHCHDEYNSLEYLDNFYSYIINFYQPFNENQAMEIFFIVLFLIIHYFSSIFLIIINKNLSSMHCLIGISFFLNLHSIKKLVIGPSEKESDSNHSNPNSYEDSAIMSMRNISYIIIETIGYPIYLEIIIFKFCGLSENSRKEIGKRAKLEEEITQANIMGIEDLNSDNQSTE